jgi:hypothetical protein
MLQRDYQEIIGLGFRAIDRTQEVIAASLNLRTAKRLPIA